MSSKPKEPTEIEIKIAQQDYSNRLKNSFKPYTEHQIKMVFESNTLETAGDVVGHSIITWYGILHYLFLFSDFSGKDKIVYSNYEQIYSKFYNYISDIRRVSKKYKLQSNYIKNNVLNYSPKYLMSGVSVEGTYPWENGSSELEIRLRAKYAKNLTKTEHFNLMTEHLKQLKLDF